jgi:hypothetical protein
MLCSTGRLREEKSKRFDSNWQQLLEAASKHQGSNPPAKSKALANIA